MRRACGFIPRPAEPASTRSAKLQIKESAASSLLAMIRPLLCVETTVRSRFFNVPKIELSRTVGIVRKPRCRGRSFAVVDPFGPTSHTPSVNHAVRVILQRSDPIRRLPTCPTISLSALPLSQKLCKVQPALVFQVMRVHAKTRIIAAAFRQCTNDPAGPTCCAVPVPMSRRVRMCNAVGACGMPQTPLRSERSRGIGSYDLRGPTRFISSMQLQRPHAVRPGSSAS